MTNAERQINRLTNTQLKEFITIRHLNCKNIDKDNLNKTTINYLSAWLVLEEFIVLEYGLKKEGLRDFDFFNITTHTVDKYTDYIVNVKGNKKSTANQRLVALSSFLKYLLKTYRFDISSEKERDINIVIESFQSRETVESDRLMLTKSQLAYINRYLTNTRLTHRERLLAMFLLVKDCLCKREELSELKVENLHLDEERPYVVIDAKNSNIARTCYLEDDTVAALKHYLFVRECLDVESEYLFISNRGKKISHETVYHAFKDIFINTGFGYKDSDGEIKTDYSLDVLRFSFKHHK